MRITGGNLRGRKVLVPRTGVRPTQDRVREALFSSLQTRLGGACFLDLYAGSGVVGLEAWSRGAAVVQWVEADRRTFRLLKANIEDLCGMGDKAVDSNEVRCSGADVFVFLKRGLADGRFDIIFADPPYEKEAGANSGCRDSFSCEGGAGRLLAAVRDACVLSPGGIMILEQGANEPSPETEGWTVVRDKVYGGTRLLSYEQSPEGRSTYD